MPCRMIILARDKFDFLVMLHSEVLCPFLWRTMQGSISFLPRWNLRQRGSWPLRPGMTTEWNRVRGMYVEGLEGGLNIK